MYSEYDKFPTNTGTRQNHDAIPRGRRKTAPATIRAHGKPQWTARRLNCSARRFRNSEYWLITVVERIKMNPVRNIRRAAERGICSPSVKDSAINTPKANSHNKPFIGKRISKGILFGSVLPTKPAKKRAISMESNAARL